MGLLPSFGNVVRFGLGIFVVGIASTASLLYLYQRSLIYPSGIPAGSRTDVMTPDKLDMPHSEVKLQTPDGETLQVFVILQDGSVEQKVRKQPKATGVEAAKSRPTVLFLHANAGNMVRIAKSVSLPYSLLTDYSSDHQGHRLPLAKVFYQRFGFNVVMLSYRGYGLSTGSASEVGIRLDAQTTLDFIRAHQVLGKTTLVVYGQSLGGAVAVDVAQRNPKDVHAIIVENT